MGNILEKPGFNRFEIMRCCGPILGAAQGDRGITYGSSKMEPHHIPIPMGIKLAVKAMEARAFADVNEMTCFSNYRP